jgi:hypothetical protein
MTDMDSLFDWMNANSWVAQWLALVVAIFGVVLGVRGRARRRSVSPKLVPVRAPINPRLALLPALLVTVGIMCFTTDPVTRFSAGIVSGIVFGIIIVAKPVGG